MKILLLLMAFAICVSDPQATYSRCSFDPNWKLVGFYFPGGSAPTECAVFRSDGSLAPETPECNLGSAGDF
jgi:hypothetical protein